MGWFDDNQDPNAWQTYADQQQMPGDGYGAPPAPPTPPGAPSAPAPNVQATSTPGTYAWHNTQIGQQYIAGFKSAWKDAFGREPTAGELWNDFLKYDRLPSASFYSEIITNVRNVAAQRKATPAAANTASTPGKRPDGQSFREWIQSQLNGKPVTQQTLLDLESALQANGSKLTPANASGERTKIWDPELGDWVRVGFGEGTWQYIPQGWGENGPQGNQGGDLMAPWTEPFAYPSYEPPPAFVAPTADEAFNDEGFKFALGEGKKALERSAAAKGTLLTTGTLKDLDQFSQGAASQQYDKVYSRRLNEHQYQGGLERGDWATDYNKALGEYRQSYDVFNNNQDRPFNKLMGVAGMGFQGTQSLLGQGQGYAGMYGNTLGNMASGMGGAWMGGANAAAAGQVGSANAWANGFNQIGNSMAPWMYQSLWNRPQGQG